MADAIPAGVLSGALGYDSGEQPNPSQSSYGYVNPQDRSDNNNHRNALSVSKYSFIRDAYCCTGGFESGYYLVPFISETLYPTRRELATYKNYVRPVVDSMVNPVFNKPINRVCKTASGIILDDSLYGAFIEDCNGAGDSLDVEVKSIITEAVLQGMSYCVMDNMPYQPETEDEAIKERAFPFIYMMGQNSVKDYHIDNFGLIQEITFCDNSIVVDGKEVSRYRRWNKWESVVLEEKNIDGKLVLVEVEKPVYHGLGFVPVYPCYYAKRKRGKLEVDSTMYDIAKQCWAIYNLDSERRDVLRKQGFSMLCIQGQANTSIAVGAGNVMYYDFEAKQAPAYASPNPDIIRVYKEETDDIIKRIFEIAEQNGVMAVKGTQEAASGIAKEWDFRAREFILKNVSNVAKRLEYWILSTFNAYTNGDIICEPKYQDTFAPNSISATLKDLDALLLLNISPTANKFIKQQAFISAFPDASEDLVSEIGDEIEGETEDIAKDREGDLAGMENGAVASGIAGQDTVQDTALNGAQIASLVDIVSQMSMRQIPTESGRAIIMAALPNVSIELINKIISPLSSFKVKVDEKPSGQDN